MPRFHLHYTEEYGGNHLSDRTSNDDRYMMPFEANDVADACQIATLSMKERRASASIQYEDVYLTGEGIGASLREARGADGAYSFSQPS